MPSVDFLSRLWAWFLSLKIWQRVGLLLLLFMLFGAALGDDSTTEELTPNETPTSEASQSPSQDSTTEVMTSPTLESSSASPILLSPVEFQSSALGDLSDMRKDVADLKDRIDEGGLIRLYGNVVELTFNVGQLQAISPGEDSEDVWKEKLVLLENAVDDFSNGLSADSVASSKRHLAKILEAIGNLEKFVKMVK